MSQHHYLNLEPPQALSLKRKPRLYNYQYLGLFLIFLIPILAVFGFFDPAHTEAKANNADLRITVEYPARYRFQTSGSIHIEVQNTSNSSFPLVTVAISTDYLKQFSELHFFPALTGLSPEYYIFELRDFEVGETRQLSIEVVADEYGQQTGSILVNPQDAETLRLDISSFTFP